MLEGDYHMTTKYKSIDYDKLKAVYYVGLTGSVTQAGDMMGLCQSAVTKQIQELEKRLNALLFEREDRRMTLTEVGRKVFNFSKFVVENSNALMNDITHSRLCMEGALHILTTPSLAATWLPHYLEGFHEVYPQITLNISASLDYLIPVETDVIIGDYKSNESDLVQLHLFTERLGFYASKKYIEKYGEPKTLEDLDHHRLLAIDKKIEDKFWYVNQILRIGKKDRRESRKACMYFSSGDALANSIISNHGIGTLSEHHEQILNNKEIVRVLQDIHTESSETYYIYHKRVEDTKKYTALYEHLIASIGKK